MPDDPRSANAVSNRLPHATGRLPRWRWPSLAAIVVAIVASYAWIWLLSDLEGGWKVAGSGIAAGVGTLALLAWIALLSGWPWRAFFWAVAAVLTLDLTFLALFRIEGLSGNLVPVLAFRWSPRRAIPPVEPIVSADREITVDLTKTTRHDYPQFLGPRRHPRIDGIPLETDWSAHPPKLLWRRPIGKGWSSFAVVGPYAITQEQRGDEELVVCYEAATGHILWSHADNVSFESVVAGDGPRATPTIADGRVYTLGATGLLNCLDGTDGSLIWQHDLHADHGATNITWGRSGSPLVIDHLVVVSAGGTDRRSLVAYDKQTGELVWTGGEDTSGYSSPTVATLAGVEQILILNQHGLVAHDPRDGSVFWSYPWGIGEPNVSQPVAIGEDRVFVSSGYGQGCALLEISRGDGGAWKATPLWRHPHMKTKFTNVVVRDGHVYGLDDPGILECVELATGKRLWKQGRYGHGQIIMVGDLLLVQAESGDVVLVDVSPEGPTELARMAVFDRKTWNNPAVSGRYLLVRNDEEAACYELPIKDSSDG